MTSNGNTNGNAQVAQPAVKQATNVSIEDLYKYFGVLADAKEDAGKHADTYLKIVAGTKSGAKEKQLASQFITRFFKYFPNEMAISIEAIFDLCEDEDANIRKAAIKDLGILCKDCTIEILNRIADILTQLLQTDDQQEFLQVQSSLLTVFKQNPKSTLGEIFNQINTAELEEVRKRAIKFLVSKLPALFAASANATTPSLFNKELEDLIIKNVKQVLLDVDAEEFILFIRLLTGLPSMSTLTGRQDLVNIIMAQSELDKPFDPNDIERIMILMSCMQEAIPLFSKNVPSTKYVSYYLENVMSVAKNISEENKFEIIKAFAELCNHYNGTNANLVAANSLNNLEILYNLLIDYLPKPTDSEIEQATAATPTLASEETKYSFSYVECLLYSFHVLAKYNPEFLATDENKERLKDFRFRLQYLAKSSQNYIKEIRNTLSVANGVKENEENKIRRVGLRVTTNIDTLIKDFFHNPPSYKSQITLSWKSNEQKANESQTGAAKRSLSVSSADTDLDGNRKKPERGIYQPPSGKYSTASNAANGANGSNGNGFKRRTFSGGASHRGGFNHRGRGRF